MIDPCSKEPSRLLALAEALAIIQGSIQPVSESEIVSLQDALGRVLASDVSSPINIPYDRNSAMDGYALSSKDINVNQVVTIRQAGVSWAGKLYPATLKPGQCVRIFTGAVVPDGADSVVIQENVSADGDSIVFPADTKPCQNIREPGEDIAQGGLLCAKQKKLSPADIGLMAAAGINLVPVQRKLNIAFFTTGDELIALGKPPEPGKIYDSNRYALSGLLSDPAYKLTDLGVIPDDKQILEDQLTQAAKGHDSIISTGGASVGDADYIEEVLAKCGEVNFWKIAIKPGKPLAFGKVGASYFFGLPGNPVSAMVTFQQVVAPALRLLSGATAYKPLRFRATCTSTLKKAPGRQEFQRGILSQNEVGDFVVASTGKQGSHILSSMSQANCYIILPADSNGVAKGEQVEVEPFTVSL